jgi:hypothetical protein
MNQIDKDQITMSILQVNEIRHVLFKTERGYFMAKIRKGESGYTYSLDGIPVGKDEQEALSKMYEIKEYTPLEDHNSLRELVKVLEDLIKSSPKEEVKIKKVTKNVRKAN